MKIAPESLRSQRTNPAVLKAQLATLRERLPNTVVIVVEGKGDLAVYEVWIRRACGGISWEPLVATGKANVLAFRELIRRDCTGLDSSTYFIVDHDYDALREMPDGSDIFVLPAYSVENFLTDVCVFESFLKVDLGVVGADGDRTLACSEFSRLERRFIDVCRKPCAKLFAAVTSLSADIKVNPIRKFVDVTLDEITVVTGGDASDAVMVGNEVPDEGVRDGQQFLAGADARFWIRGKYMLFFFRKVCQLFYDDRIAGNPRYFSKSGHGLHFSVATLSLETLAARSALPDGFRDTLLRWTRIGVAG